MFNFSENRDRCKLSLYLPPTLEEMQRDNTYQMQICQTDCQRFDTWQHVTSYNLPRNGTEAIPDWENNLKAGIKYTSYLLLQFVTNLIEGTTLWLFSS
jgi:hypothetical protein